MQFDRSNGDGENIEDQMQSAMGEAKNQAVSDAAGKVLGKVFGVLTGFLFMTFFVPFVAVYAYNGMQPPVWPDVSYLPAVAGFFVFRHLIHMLRSE